MNEQETQPEFVFLDDSIPARWRRALADKCLDIMHTTEVFFKFKFAFDCFMVLIENRDISPAQRALLNRFWKHADKKRRLAEAAAKSDVVKFCEAQIADGQ